MAKAAVAAPSVDFEAIDRLEQKLKQLKLSIRNAPQGQSGASLGKCIFTGEPATQEVLIARAY